MEIASPITAIENNTAKAATAPSLLPELSSLLILFEQMTSSFILSLGLLAGPILKIERHSYHTDYFCHDTSIVIYVVMHTLHIP